MGLPSHMNDWSKTFEILLDYPNIIFQNVQLDQLSAGTPLEGWVATSNIFNSMHVSEHVSDILRVLLLYKFGGTYLDVDHMVLRRLNATQRNFLILDHGDRVSNSILDFKHSGAGHDLLHKFLR